MKTRVLTLIFCVAIAMIFFVSCGKNDSPAAPVEITVIVTVPVPYTPTATATISATSTATPDWTATDTATPAATQTAWVIVASYTVTETITITSTQTATGTATDTVTATLTFTNTATFTSSPTATATPTATPKTGHLMAIKDSVVFNNVYIDYTVNGVPYSKSGSFLTTTLPFNYYSGSSMPYSFTCTSEAILYFFNGLTYVQFSSVNNGTSTGTYIFP